MTAEERQQRLVEIQSYTAEVFTSLLRGGLTAEQGRAAFDLLTLMADIVDLADGLARRSQTK